ncbi:MAG: AAA family ATPase, partial [Acidobacteriota bacterium]
LIDYLFNDIKKESEDRSGFKDKVFTPLARNLLLAYQWPGNIRELRSTLVRAAFWSTLRSKSNKIDEEDVRYALSQSVPLKTREVLNRPIGNGFKIEALLEEVARHYLERAFNQANGNNSEAAKLIGLSNYQTFINWKKKYCSDKER